MKKLLLISALISIFGCSSNEEINFNKKELIKIFTESHSKGTLAASSTDNSDLAESISNSGFDQFILSSKNKNNFLELDSLAFFIIKSNRLTNPKKG